MFNASSSIKRPLFITAVISLLVSPLVSALPQYDADKHLGVASCASSVCHGKSKPVKDENVMLNEYRTWSTEDRHARAYQTLLSDESKRIAKNLGLKSAHTAKICLDCHADNVAKDKRGPKFQINDGVGCEACHGGGEQWIESHTEEGVTHQQNLDKNMFATEDGVARAKLCLSCHYGTKDKLANHKIMGAGHPRLTFELETFTANQPSHYLIDADYLKRKGEFSGFSMWIVGQLETTKSSLDLMGKYLISDDHLVPELYFYDCHACHHPMSDIRWQATSAKAGIPPGVIRLNDANFLMLLELTNEVLPKQSGKLKAAIVAMHAASVTNKSALKKAVADLSGIVTALEKPLTATKYTAQQTRSVRARLLKQAAAGEYRDFSTAEQAFLAIESITIALKQDGQLEKQLDSLYGTLEDEDRFKPQQFKSVAATVKGAFN
ncbi:cytochrome c family protein [Oceanicoccus sp. KOV_DT_Chl]|uniref:cytochrome c family protein n=1 Tax=Oceanicoccus sp. KOV_DT_Chl TaxID=1904639 RepID=UPI000C7BFBEB|nr:cytochrome c family protein [Oceanicoccus sp. KOV_DT_Chl]